MKIVAIIAVSFFATAQALSSSQKMELEKHRTECIAEIKIDMGLVDEVKDGDFTMENDTLKKYALCMLVKSRIMTTNGNLSKDAALHKVPKAASIEKIVDDCMADTGDTPEQTAWNYAKCYHEQNPNHIIL